MVDKLVQGDRLPDITFNLTDGRSPTSFFWTPFDAGWATEQFTYASPVLRTPLSHWKGGWRVSGTEEVFDE